MSAKVSVIVLRWVFPGATPQIPPPLPPPLPPFLFLLLSERGLSKLVSNCSHAFVLADGPLRSGKWALSRGDGDDGEVDKALSLTFPHFADDGSPGFWDTGAAPLDGMMITAPSSLAPVLKSPLCTVAADVGALLSFPLPVRHTCFTTSPLGRGYKCCSFSML